MKIMTILGTRPEIIRLSLVISKLDLISYHVLVNTGQNYEECLNDIFFKELKVRKPDHALGIRADTSGEQIGNIIIETEKIMIKEKPDRILILGDTNSGLSSIAAKRLKIPVYHMEAGNRCYDDAVPEEVNRRIIDHSSDILMPYTNRSKENLLREGIAKEKIFVTGNPIYEVLEFNKNAIDASNIFSKLNLETKKYFLVTIHRTENVDVKSRLESLINSLDALSQKYDLPVICSLHPRTKSAMEKLEISFEHKHVKYLVPPGFFDFIALEKNALCVLSDSGTVQEECCLFHVPNITLRDVTERPETIECGSAILTGVSEENILATVSLVINKSTDWKAPSEYLVPDVSDRVVKILLGH
ncbi:MAG: UDP-N-acetylglucosamine 2-epimerase (non-hydrolyzing) [bacterium]